MSHFPKHLPVQWELFRNEPLKEQIRKEALRQSIEEVDKGRGETDGLWWRDQKYVDVVLPAEYVHPDSIDTYNYRYQVFARPTPFLCDHGKLASLTDQQPPVRYNIKRIAQCKPTYALNPELQDLCHHSQMGDPTSSRKDSKNHSSEKAPAIAESPAHPASSALERTDHTKKVDSNVSDHWMPGFKTLKARAECRQRDAPDIDKISSFPFVPHEKNTNINHGFETLPSYQEKSEIDLGSPRSCCDSFSSTRSANQNDADFCCSRFKFEEENFRPAHPEENFDDRLNGNFANRCKQLSQSMGHREPSGADVIEICEMKPPCGDIACNNVAGSALDITSPRGSAIQILPANRKDDVNNNKKSLSLSSRSSFSAAEPSNEIHAYNRASSRRENAHPTPFFFEDKREQRSASASHFELRSQQRTGRGKRFGYVVAASKDNIASLLDRNKDALPPVSSATGKKTARSILFSNSFFSGTTYPQEDTTRERKSSKRGKRTGYKLQANKDSVIFSLSPLKEMCPLVPGGSRRSCQVGGYRTSANSDNIKSLIFAENSNGNNSLFQSSENEEAGDWFGGCSLVIPMGRLTVIVDRLIVDSETCTGADTQEQVPWLNAASLHYKTLHVSCYCSNNNAAITDPILGIQLNRMCTDADRPLTARPLPSARGSLIKEDRVAGRIPYETYKIVGGKQYRSRPPEDLLSELKLPPLLAEYVEFTKRYPCFHHGRYDRTDPANEMLLPSDEAMNTLRMTLKPFVYARNPKADKYPPLFCLARELR